MGCEIVASDLPVSGIIPITQMSGEDSQETQRLRNMEQKAREISSAISSGAKRFVTSGAAVGDVFAVFLAHIRPSRPSVDEYVWVIVGDLPSAYLVTDDCANPKEALEGYIWEMRKWVTLARDGRNSEDVISVNAPATPEFAEALESRLDALERKIIPMWFASTGDNPIQ